MKALTARLSARRLVLLQVVPVFSLIVALIALVFIHERYQKAEGMGHAREVAQFELSRMTALFNYRLNELREELLHLYGEQMNLARALNESERERLVFFRRDYLLAYAVLVQGDGGKWEIQKSFLREGYEQPPSLFQEAMAGIHPPGFWLKRVSGLSDGRGEDGYVVAFVSNDQSGKPFGQVGIFRPAYVFPFCRFFSDSLGAMSINAFALDENGKALCHSQGRFENTTFKDYAFYNVLHSASGTVSQARYANVSDTNVTAAVRKIVPGDVSFVAEAAEVSPWEIAVPTKALAVAGGVVLVLTILAGTAMSVQLTSMPRIADKFEIPIVQGEVQEFSKLRREVQELEGTVLEMQSTLALVTGFQKASSELPTGEDPAKFLIQYLSSWEISMHWLPAVESTDKICHEVLHNDSRITLEPYSDANELTHNEQLKKRLSENCFSAPQHETLIYPVSFKSSFFGILAVKRPEGEAAKHLDVVPQLTQILALVKKAGVA